MAIKDQLNQLYNECRAELEEAIKHCRRIPDKECEERIKIMLLGIDAAQAKLQAADIRANDNQTTSDRDGIIQAQPTHQELGNTREDVDSGCDDSLRSNVVQPAVKF